MNDSQCATFLRWALPRLGMRWAGFRTVRRQVCKRLRHRVAELGLTDLPDYRSYLEQHPEEWAVLDGLTHVTISRFHRDRGMWAFRQREVLPVLAAGAVARGSVTIEVWSAGCASGEEPYTVAIMWQLELAHRFAPLAIRILATDVDDAMLTRARRGCFTAGSLTELPERWRAAAFAHHDQRYRLRDHFKQRVTIARYDIRTSPPDRPFDLVLCRNLAFTYFDRELQRTTTVRIATTLQPGPALVLGSPGSQRVATDVGSHDADFLVVAMGADYDMAATPGFEEGGYEYYSLVGAVRLRDALSDFEGGRVLVSVLGQPFKCPLAPFEGSFVLHEHFTQQGIRDAVHLATTFPMQRPVPVTGAVSQMFRDALASRGIEELPQHLVTSIDPTARKARLATGETLPYDLFVGIPVHRAGAARGLGRAGRRLGARRPDQPSDQIPPRVLPRRLLHGPTDRP